jgi:hypothetical protein
LPFVCERNILSRDTFDSQLKGNNIKESMSSRTELVPSSPLKRGKKGWAPLVYPASALCGDQDNDSQKDHLFPFEENVVRAALRELLILDKSVSSDNLGLSLGTIYFRGGFTGRSYLQHVDPDRWQPLPIIKNKKSIGKKRSITMSHKAKKMAKTNSERVMEAGNDDNTWENTEKKVANAEALVDVIVLRATNDQLLEVQGRCERCQMPMARTTYLYFHAVTKVSNSLMPLTAIRRFRDVLTLPADVCMPKSFPYSWTFPFHLNLISVSSLLISLEYFFSHLKMKRCECFLATNLRPLSVIVFSWFLLNTYLM